MMTKAEKQRLQELLEDNIEVAEVEVHCNNTPLWLAHPEQ
jgi:hypothetical protein